MLAAPAAAKFLPANLASMQGLASRPDLWAPSDLRWIGVHALDPARALYSAAVASYDALTATYDDRNHATPYGPACKWDGEDGGDQRIEFDDAAVSDLTSTCTILQVMQLGNATIDEGTFYYGNSNGGNDPAIAIMYNAGAARDQMQVRVTAGATPTRDIIQTAVGSAPEGTMVAFLVRYDDPTITCYLDGVKVIDQSHSTGGDLDPGTATFFLIGNRDKSGFGNETDCGIVMTTCWGDPLSDADCALLTGSDPFAHVRRDEFHLLYTPPEPAGASTASLLLAQRAINYARCA